MLNFSFENLVSAEEKTPPPLRVWLYDEEMIRRLGVLAAAHRADRGVLSALIGYTLTGLLPVRVLAIELSEEVSLPENDARGIAQDIRREILAPVAHDLAALQPQAEKNYAEMMREAGSAPAQQPLPPPGPQ